MAITSSQTDGIDRIQVATGSYLDDATTPAAASITVGFTPRYIRVENQTDRIMLEWMQGMTSAHALKTVAAGTRTAETSGGITILSTNKGFSFAVTQNKQYRWKAES